MIEIRILLKGLFIEALTAALNYIQFLDDANFTYNSPCTYSKGHSLSIPPLLFPLDKGTKHQKAVKKTLTVHKKGFLRL